MTLTYRFYVDQKIYVESKIVANTKRSFDGEGRMFIADGTTLATGTARYILAPLDKIVTDNSIHAENMMVMVDEPLPEFFEF